MFRTLDPRTGLQLSTSLSLISLLFLGTSPATQAAPLTFETPGGPVTIELTHAGPRGELVSPPPPEATAFRPPAIFSAPLPTGSGARALGFAGAFTAVADDATAASWNPGGLTQLECPEASAVYRISTEKDKHKSSDSNFRVGEDDFSSYNLNYFSIVFPFYFRPARRNFVFSLNYQEAYDFEQQFTADLSGLSTDRESASASASFGDTQVDTVKDDVFDITITSVKSTDTSTTFDQLLNSDLISGVDFDQEGVIAAFSPALAAEITPKISVGAAFNYYHIDPLTGDKIESRTRAGFSGQSASVVDTRTSRTTSGTFSYAGTVTLPPSGTRPFPLIIPVRGAGPFSPFTDTSASRTRDTLLVDGVFEEINMIEDLHGYNATFGLLATVNRHLSIGATVDLPWTAEAEQTKITRTSVTTYDASHTRVVNQFDSKTVVTKDIEFEFPLYWALGFVWRWFPELYTTLDISQTRWSDFSFMAEGEPSINPLDGSPHGEKPLDDTWSLRLGTEYLLVLPKTEVPFRVGAAWDERPAIGSPDDVYSLSCGSGFSVGKDPGRTIIDFAYIFTFANDTTSLIPDQAGLTTDVREHQGFVSVIKHF